MDKDTEFGAEWKFSTTPWTDILSARDITVDERARRMTFLIERYWRPVYHFIRRNGKPSEDAKDLTQSFFVMVLDTDFVATADPTRGKFRTYLLTALTRFLSREFRHERVRPNHPLKGTLFVARLEDEGELSDTSLTPQQEFDRQWALSIINIVLERLKEHCEKKGEEKAFQIFSRQLLSGTDPIYGSVKTLSMEFNLDPQKVNNAVRKCIRWFREMFCQEVRAYVSSDSEVEREIRELWQMLG